MRRGEDSEKKIADELFRATGPLGPFATKIRLAYMLRIIAEPTYRDLIIISRIRNRFAHDLSLKSFEDQKISGWIKNMHIYGIVKKMGEEGKERLKNRKEGDDQLEITAAFIKSNALLSMYDTYRDCLRYVIHHIVDYENAIIEKEEMLNQQSVSDKQAPSPDKSE